MKQFVTFAAFATALTLVLSGCINDKFNPAAGNEPIRFVTSIGEKTRASGTAWGENDAIGVYMISADGSFADDCLASNVKHTHTGGGKFAAADGDALYYPADGGAVDFVAYYPHKEGFDDYGYPIDVSDQSDPAAIDFMYSDNATGYSSDVPFLRFHHKLVKLVFNVTDSDGALLEGLTATIGGMKTAGVYDLSEDELILSEGSEHDIDLVLVAAEDATASMEAIVLPDSGIKPKVTFTFADGQTAVLSLTDVTYLERNAYTYNITVSSAAEVVEIGGSEIVNWIDGWDEGDASGNHAIEKTPADNGGNGEITEYYLEIFGEDNSQFQPSGNWQNIDYFTEWSSGCADVTYTNSGSQNAVIRNFTGKGNSLYLREKGTNDVAIAGLPAGYTDITLSFDMACHDDGIVNPLRIYAGTTEVTPAPPATLNTKYSPISIPLPDGTTSIRLYGDLPVGKALLIDNLRLEGRK